MTALFWRRSFFPRCPFRFFPRKVPTNWPRRWCPFFITRCLCFSPLNAPSLLWLCTQLITMDYIAAANRSLVPPLREERLERPGDEPREEHFQGRRTSLQQQQAAMQHSIDPIDFARHLPFSQMSSNMKTSYVCVCVYLFSRNRQKAIAWRKTSQRAEGSSSSSPGKHVERWKEKPEKVTVCEVSFPFGSTRIWVGVRK